MLMLPRPRDNYRHAEYDPLFQAKQNLNVLKVSG